MATQEIALPGATKPILSFIERLHGLVVTGDAAFTFRPIVEAIRKRGGDYFLFVKANQPEPEGEIARAFGDVPPSGRDRRRSGSNRRAA